ncbi:MAG: response regulator, partial [Muribaculaceae bacterium]|nr:response regulator [Muribaculaceae bacterium]
VMNMHKVDVNKLITTVCAGIDMSSRPHVRLEKKFALDQCYITSDSYRITQVLNNLITNAVKFTERGSITVGYEVYGAMLKFFVKDTGIGLTENDLKKLFTRFTKLNSFVQGTGLGLSISKAIVEKLGGSIKGESAGKSKGSTFYFTLPMVINESAEQETQSQQDDERRVEELKLKANAERRRKQLEAASYDEKATKPSYKMEKKKILVVEDNPSNAELFDAILADRYDLVHATDGKEAVQVYVKETPDLVLMDLNLPIKDGYEATAEIRTLSNAVPIIAVTAYAQNSDRVKVLNSGFDDYLSKPVDENLLIDTIRKFLG